jgi:hypothetical protein
LRRASWKEKYQAETGFVKKGTVERKVPGAKNRNQSANGRVWLNFEKVDVTTPCLVDAKSNRITRVLFHAI